MFDPNEVYIVGYVSDVNQYVGPYGIAPVTAPDQALVGIPLFATLSIRPSDGHLLYSYLGSDAQGNGVITALYEFIPGNTDVADPMKGEPIVVDGPSLCANSSRGSFGVPNAPARYAVGLDGAAYYSCTRDPATSDGRESWFLGSLELPVQRYPNAIGSGGRILGSADDGSLAVFDATSGMLYASPSASELFSSSSPAGAVDVRAHSGGFWLAGASGTWTDAPPFAVDYVDLDLSGEVVAQGHYPPMPQGVTLPSNNWTTRYPVIDGYGALYQLAMLGDDGIIVKRPMTGESTIVYRTSQWDATHPHTVLNPEYLVTGGRRSN